MDGTRAEVPTPEFDHAALRELFLSAPESEATQVVAILIAVLLLSTVFWLVYRRKLREEFTPIWVVTALGILLASMRLDLLHGLTRAVGAWTTSSTVFLVAIVFLMAICLSYAVRLSRASIQIKNLAQETALLRARLERLEQKVPDA